MSVNLIRKSDIENIISADLLPGTLTYRGVVDEFPVECKDGDVVTLAGVDSPFLRVNSTWDSLCDTAIDTKYLRNQTDAKFSCRFCGTERFYDSETHTPHCPNCGALMSKIVGN